MNELNQRALEEAIKTWPRHWQEYNLREALTKAIMAYEAKKAAEQRAHDREGGK